MERLVDRLALALSPLDADVVASTGSPLLRGGLRVVGVEIRHASRTQVDVTIEPSRDEDAREGVNLCQRIELLLKEVELLAFGQGGPRWRVAIALAVLPFQIAGDKKRLLIESRLEEDMLGRLLDIDAAIGLVGPITLAILDLARSARRNEVDAGEFLIGVGLFQILPHRLGEVLNAELECGLPSRDLVFAGECVHIALVILADCEASHVELGKIK